MKKIKMFMGAVLCMNLLAVSGCDRVVQSAVVEEKDETDGIFCIMETIHTVYKYGRKLWCGFINEPLFWSSH